MRTTYRCNEEDHCRIISMQNGGDVWSVFARFCKISDTIKEAAEANGAKLMFNDRLGFLGTCPSNLGTGLRASVMIKCVLTFGACFVMMLGACMPTTVYVFHGG
jgi:protein-arginine kinase